MIERKSPSPKTNCTPTSTAKLPADAPLRWRHGLPRTRRMRRVWPPGVRKRMQSACVLERLRTKRCRERLKVDTLLRSGRKWRAIAAAVAAFAFLVGGVSGWMARGTTEVAAAAGPADQIAREALSAHKLYIAEVRHPIEVGAAEAHLMPWLSRRSGTNLRIPDFSHFDLKLLGGRLLPGPSGPAALFMFENGNGDRVTFYCSKAGPQQMAFRYLQSGQCRSDPLGRERLYLYRQRQC